MPKSRIGFDFQKIKSEVLRSRPRQANIHRWLTLRMTLLIVAAVMIAGLPAIGVTWLLMDEQLQLRVRSAQASTLAFFTSEQTQLQQITQLISVRPTLCNLLLQHDNDQQLVPYLDKLREDTPVDALVIVSADGRTIVSGSGEIPIPDLLIAQNSLPAADFIALEGPARMAIFAASEIVSAAGCVRGQAGKVITLQVFDNDFMNRLAADTGLEQSLVMRNYRIATSLPHAAAPLLSPDTALPGLDTTQACCTVGTIADKTYYVGLTPVTDKHGSVVAISEVALPVNTIRNIAVNMVVLLLAIGVCAALGGIGLASWFTRRITGPLSELSNAAEWIGAGDLETPVPSASGWVEIDQVANQLEHSRRNLRYIQQITRRGIRHIAQILNETQEGIAIINMDGVLTWVNSEVGHILGYEAQHLLGKNYSQVFRPASGEAMPLNELLRTSVSSLQPKRLAILDARNHPIMLTVSASLVETEKHTPLQPSYEYILTLRDVSEEDAYNRLRSEFLANLAHEFRTPLSAISASAELLVDEGQNMTAAELSDLTNVISLSTVHLQMLVNNLLENALIDAGVFRLRSCPVRLQDMLHNVAEMMAPLLRRRQQHLEVDAPEADVTFWGDPGRLDQALINLLENASKFSPSGGVIAISVSRQADVLTVAVLDSGPGLPSERFGDLFTRYVTGEHPRSAQYGIGMGLPIVKAIIEAHGGEVGAQTRPEGGAKVWFTLPLQQSGEQGEGP